MWQGWVTLLVYQLLWFPFHSSVPFAASECLIVIPTGEIHLKCPGHLTLTFLLRL